MPPEADPSPNPAVRLTALSLADAATVLSKASGKSVTEAMLREDIAAGAPVNPDGTLNLIHLAAWLVKEISVGD